MNEFNHKIIESKWQKIWAEKKPFKAEYPSDKPKYYPLIEFPYPSGEGLHTGHPRSYCAIDIIARKKRMEGYNVLYPIGWDAFGLPTENYAIKVGRPPQEISRENIDTFRRQLKSLGISFDWDREINTTDPKYYRWTQWIFLQLFKHGLAYKVNIAINWCLNCKIGLANEEVVGGVCERCGGPIERRQKEQWMLEITKYADRLLFDLDEVDYLEKIKIQQKNWIGRSEGVKVKFEIRSSKSETNSKFPNSKIETSDRFLEVFTTRPDTLFGATFMVVAPEHPLISNMEYGIWNIDKVKDYIDQALKQTDLERSDEKKEKTGVELQGVKAINPVSGEEIPIFIADYVMMGYGTGAIMAVPAHDARDWQFAKKYNLLIKQVIALDLADFNKTLKLLEIWDKLYQKAKKENLNIWLLSGMACPFYVGTIWREHHDLDVITKTEEDFNRSVNFFTENGFEKIRENKFDNELSTYIFQNADGVQISMGPNRYKFGLREDDFEEEEKDVFGFRALVLSERYQKEFKNYRGRDKDKLDLEFLNGRVIAEDGFLVNSGDFSNLSSKEASEKITQWLEEKGLGSRSVSYKLRDWVFSRQHYWGEPIPVIYCHSCFQERSKKKEVRSKLKIGRDYIEIADKEYAIVPVQEDQLPVELPVVEKYQPTDSGESPLSTMTDWVNTQCPVCGSAAIRETDTMPNWAGSSWYFLRYIDPENDHVFADHDKLKYWLPVDLYNGGMEHTTLHLLYSRFWHKFLFDIDVVPTKEPYQRRVSHGMILAEDGQKMSKSKGNVVNPDEMVDKFGADAFRLYEMFLGPFDQVVNWQTDGIRGPYRFLEKIWRLSNNIKEDKDDKEDIETESQINKLIVKISSDIDNLQFNTAVSAMMEFINAIEKQKKISQSVWNRLLIILSPFAPHLAEELWSQTGQPGLVCQQRWPKVDKSKIIEEEIVYAVQINGKVRASFNVNANIAQAEVIAQAKDLPNVQKYLTNHKIQKEIFVPNKIINFVI